MKKLDIILDMDGILVDLLGHWLKAINAEFPGLNATKNDITRWHMHECPKLAHISPVVLTAYLERPAFFYDAPFIEGAVFAAGALLADGHNVRVVTATPPFDEKTVRDVEAQKRAWLEAHLPALADKVHFVTSGTEKVAMKAHVFVDDRADTLVAYKEMHPEALVCGIRYPYNAHAARPPIMLMGDHDDTITAWGHLISMIQRHAYYLTFN